MNKTHDDWTQALPESFGYYWVGVPSVNMPGFGESGVVALVFINEKPGGELVVYSNGMTYPLPTFHISEDHQVPYWKKAILPDAPVAERKVVR
jgi:hypothetical protein